MRLRLGRLLRGRGLSARVFWLTVGIILLVEIAILVPSLGRERNAWLWDRVIDGHLAAYSEVMASQNGLTAGFDQQTQSGLLALSGNLSINLINPATHLNIVLATPGPAVAADVRVDLSRESLLTSAMRADLALLGLGGQFIEITAPAAIAQGVTVRVVVSAASLAQHLRAYAGHIALLSVMIALITGLLLFAALNRMLVKPLRIMTASIAGFRRDPEILRHDELDWLAAQREDEIAGAARELVVMQEELRAALWRNARLAAVGTAVAKISHDLRNILTSALLVADRLQDAADPAVKRAANTLIPAVERAAQLVSLTVDFAREGPPALIRSEVVLRELIEEAAIVVRPEDGMVVIENLVPSNVVVSLDRAQIYRVLANLLRNAAEAGARRIVLSLEGQNGLTQLVIADDGPGVPDKVRENLFRPFTGSGRRGGTGLGLAIARDLARAHGGDLELRRSDKQGTVFVLGLAGAEEQLIA